MRMKINFILWSLTISLVGCVPQTQQTAHQVTPQDFVIQTIFLFLTLFGVYWLLVIRPQQLKATEQSKLQETLKKGDDVVTSGGILGKLVSSAPDAATIEIAPNCKIRVQWAHLQPAAVKKKESAESDTAKKSDKK